MSKDLPPVVIAEKIRGACIQAAREGFTDASMSGLCTEGAMKQPLVLCSLLISKKSSN